MKKTELLSTILFCILFFISITVYLSSYTLAHEDIAALLLLLWCAFAFTRFLQMFEIHTHPIVSEQSAIHKFNLPKRLLMHLSHPLSDQKEKESWRFINFSFYTSLFLFLIYLSWGSLVSFYPSYPHGYVDTLRSIHENFYSLSGETLETSFLPSMFFYFLNMLFLWTMALVFAVLLQMSSSQENNRSLLWICLSLFVISLLFYFIQGPETVDFFRLFSMPSHTLWYGYGWAVLPVLQEMELIQNHSLSLFQMRLMSVGIPGTVILYSLAFFMVLHFLRGAILSKQNAQYALLGLMILIIMLGIDIFIIYYHSLNGILLAGWASLAVLSVLSHQERRKTYRFYMP